MVLRHRRRGDLYGQFDRRARCAEDSLPRAESAGPGGAVDLQVRHNIRGGHLHCYLGTTVVGDFVLSSSCAVERWRPCIE